MIGPDDGQLSTTADSHRGLAGCHYNARSTANVSKAIYSSHLVKVDDRYWMGKRVTIPQTTLTINYVPIV